MCSKPTYSYAVKSYSKETYCMLKNVINGLIKENEDPDSAVSIEDHLNRAARLTGLHIDGIRHLSTTDVNIERIQEIDRRIIHYELMQHYLTKKSLPTCKELFGTLQMIIPVYMDMKTFLRSLVEMGYIFKKRGGTVVVLERPKIKFERFMYLKKIKQFRAEQKPIYYIGEASILSNGKVLTVDESNLISHEKLQLRFIYAANIEDGVCFYFKTESFNEVTFESWIRKEIVSKLDARSVIIFNNSKHHCATFCDPLESLESSLTDDIIEWLEYHKIPYNVDMSKLQLWKLVENFTDIGANMYIIDNLLIQNGHNVLRLPDCINEMSLASGVRQILSKNTNLGIVSKKLVEAEIETILKSINTSELDAFNATLIQEESNLFDLEMELDEMWDDICKNTEDISNPEDYTDFTFIYDL